MRKNEESMIQSLRLLPVFLATVALVACGKPHDATGSASRSTNEPAALAIDTVTATVTVKSIDYGTRTVTLKDPNGSTQTYKAGPDVINFDQIHVGDTVRATVTEALVVSVRKALGPPNLGDTVTVALAPKGAKPGMFIANTVEATSKIEAIDPGKRTITLEDLAGRLKTIKLASGVKVSDLIKGDVVVVRYSEALALSVEKP